MKKNSYGPLYFALIFFILSIQLFGCGSSQSVQSTQKSENETQAENMNLETPASSAEELSKNTDSLTEQNPPDEKEPEEATHPNQYVAHAANRIMTFDVDGNKLFEHNLNKISEQFAGRTSSYKIEPDDCILERNGILYYSNYDQGKVKLLAVNPETDEI